MDIEARQLLGRSFLMPRNWLLRKDSWIWFKKNYLVDRRCWKTCTRQEGSLVEGIEPKVSRSHQVCKIRQIKSAWSKKKYLSHKRDPGITITLVLFYLVSARNIYFRCCSRHFVMLISFYFKIHYMIYDRFYFWNAW